MENSGRFSALYSRDFRLFWIGQLISFSGTWMHSTAQGWLVYSLTKSPFYLGIVSAVGSFPVLLFTLLGGVVADRIGKRNLLIVTQALSMLPALLIGALTTMEVIKVWHVMALVGFLGTVNAFDLPARQSFLIEMVERGNLLNAVALNSAAFNAARIIGPIIAAMTIAYVGLAACFYLNALSFLPVILALVMVRARPKAPSGRESILREFMDGMRFVRNEPYVLRVMIMVAIFSLFGIPFITMLPVFAEEVLSVGVKGLGFLAASAGIGAFIAAVSIAFKGDVKEYRLMHFTPALFSLALIGFAFSTNYRLSMALLALAGWSLVSFLAIANSSVQLRSPDGLRGRVMSVYTLVFLGLAPVGNSIIGLLAERIGTPNAVALSSGVCLMASVAMSGGLSGAMAGVTRK